MNRLRNAYTYLHVRDILEYPLPQGGQLVVVQAAFGVFVVLGCGEKWRVSYDLQPEAIPAIH